MRTSVKIVILAVMLIGAGAVYGQGYVGARSAHGHDIETFRSYLSVPDTLSGASVRVVEYGSAADVIYDYDSAGHPSTVEGYRVRIFVDNGQDAGENSAAAQEMFRQQFPSIPTYRTYESPSWVVAVGNCTSMEEALILQNRVRGAFKIALPWKGEIPLTEFLKEGDGLPEPEEEEIPTDETEQDSYL